MTNNKAEESEPLLRPEKRLFKENDRSHELQLRALAEERIATLGSLAILRGLKETTITKLASACSWRNVSKRQQIFSANDESRDLYFLLSGKVRVILYSPQGRRVSFGILEAGEMFGEIAAIDGLPRSAAVEAVQDCRLAVLSSASVERFVAEEPAFALILLRKLAANVRHLSERIFEFSALMVRQRTQAELLRLAKLRGDGSKQVLLSPAPTTVEIAARIGTRHEQVSREIVRLIKDGLLQRVDGDLLILDLDRLSDLVREARGE